MADTTVDHETQNFLRELDSFGEPPPPQRLIHDSDVRLVSKEFQRKLQGVNVDKVKRVRGAAIDNGTPFYSPARSSVSEEISKEDIQKWKDQVISASRPTYPRYVQQLPSSSDFSRPSTLSSAAPESFRVSRSEHSPMNVATVSGENIIFSAASASRSERPSNASKATSLSSLNGRSNIQTSASSFPTTSYSNSLSGKREGIFHATPYTVGSVPSSESLKKAYYHSGPPQTACTGNQYSNGNDSLRSKGKEVIRISMRNANVAVTSSASDNRPPNVNRSNNQSTVTKRQASIGNDHMPNGGRQGETVLSWRKAGATYRIEQGEASKQQKKYDELTEKIEEQLNNTQKAIGVCGVCNKPLGIESEITCALGQLYHQKCFVCDMCGRTLRGKKFYEVKGKTYCEEDYLYAGVHETAERCAACSHLIIDMVLHALGKSYHPQCFRCSKCKTCLDGIPFAIDSQGSVYCMSDYHQMFAPTCAACSRPILPTNEFGETVRVVAIDNDYHVECYVCEGCGCQLSDDPERQCFPLNSHLLCKNCHIHWVRTGGDKQPITDL